MGKEFVDEFSEARLVFEEASDALSMDMESLCFADPEAKLNLTEFTQPAILTTSIAILRVLEAKGIAADCAAGLSLGEYAALVYAKAFDFRTAVQLVRLRGRLMQDAVPAGIGGLAAVVGLPIERIESLVTETQDGFLEIANYNTPMQTVVGGEVQALEGFVLRAKEAGAKIASLLPVSAPFHTELLKPAQVGLAKELESIQVNPMRLPVYANVLGDLYPGEEQVKALLAEQVASPVRWVAIMNALLADGVDTFVEIGPGKTLTGFVKRFDKSKNAFAVENLKGLSKLLKAK
jgi:[acyl-carrier-protein] S-malonyltransferase